MGKKVKEAYITPTFSGAYKWAELLRNPCVLRGPQKRGENQKRVRHPCLVRGPQMGRNAM